MANCMTLTGNICRGCLDNVGGIKKAYFASTKELECAIGTTGGITLNSTTTSGEIGDITYATGAVCNWFKFEPSKNTGNYVETINISAENGTTFYNGVLTMNYNKQEMTKINTISEMAKGDITILFQDANNKYWLLTGLNATVTSGIPTAYTLDGDNGCMLGGTSFQTGTAKGDANGASITFTCDMSRPIVEVVKPSTVTSPSMWSSIDAITECTTCE